MKKTLYIIMCGLMLAACSNRHKASSSIEAFLTENLANPEFKTEYITMDSTRKLKDSVIVALQQQASADKAFKRNIRWEKPTDGKYIFVRMKVIQQQDTAVRTFYLNPEMTAVVALKQN